MRVSDPLIVGWNFGLARETRFDIRHGGHGQVQGTMEAPPAVSGRAGPGGTRLFDLPGSGRFFSEPIPNVFLHFSLVPFPEVSPSFDIVGFMVVAEIFPILGLRTLRKEDLPVGTDRLSPCRVDRVFGAVSPDLFGRAGIWCFHRLLGSVSV